MYNSQITQGNLYKNFIYWAVFNPLLSVSFRIYFFFFILIFLFRQLKTVFSCSRILYLCLESLGLDITSVIFNRFKMAATYHFCDFFPSNNHINGWFLFNTLLIWSKEFYQLKKKLWIWNLLELDLFDLYIENRLTKLSQFIDWY